MHSADRVRVTFVRHHGTGLLAQAKLGLSQKVGKTRLKWGRLTTQQVRKFSKHSDYSSLLLYRLLGPKRSELQEFRWQLAGGYDSAAAKKWLALDSLILFGIFTSSLKSY